VSPLKRGEWQKSLINTNPNALSLYFSLSPHLLIPLRVEYIQPLPPATCNLTPNLI